MARYKITSLNYITAGKKHAFVNVDAALDYKQPTKIKLLANEGISSASEVKLSVITVDQGNIESIDTEYISKESDEPLSIEGMNGTIVLKEDQTAIKNVEAQDKAVLMLKTAEDLQSTLASLREFQSQMSAIANLTYEIETDSNDAKNVLVQEDDKVQLLPMYDVRNLAVKTSNKKKMQNRLPGTDKYVDLYAPDMASSPLKLCEANGYSYMLLDTTRSTPQSLNACINDNEDNSYYMQIASRKMKTYAYPTLDQLNTKALADGSLLEPAKSFEEYFALVGTSARDAMQQMFEPATNYSNLKYNYILDFDQNKTSLDFDKGDIYAANINVAKNAFDSTYSVRMPDKDTIANARQYCSIGSANNTVFLTYVDDVKYLPVMHNQSNEGPVDVKMKATTETERHYVISQKLESEE